MQKQKAPPRNMRILISFDKEGVIEKMGLRKDKTFHLEEWKDPPVGYEMYAQSVSYSLREGVVLLTIYKKNELVAKFFVIL